jgi:hypothetical protein
MLIEKRAGSDECVLKYECDGTRVDTFCWFIQDRWLCDCFAPFGNGDFVHTMEGVEGFATCEVMSDICKNWNQPEFATPEDCGSSWAGVALDDCYKATQFCSRTFSTRDGVEGMTTRQRDIQCFPGTMPYVCSCDEQGYVVDLDIADCGVLLDHCGMGKEFDGPLECATASSSGANDCSTIIDCKKSVDPSNHVWRPTEGRSATCKTTPSGDTHCDCAHFGSGLSLRTELPANDADTCNRVVEACAHFDELAFSGPFTCESDVQSVSEAYCSLTATCMQEGSLGEETIRGEGRLFAECRLEGDSWSCECQARALDLGVDQRAAIEVEGDDGWEVCTAAMNRCPDVVDIQVGVVDIPD